MSGRIPAIIGSTEGADAVFPVLTADQIARIAAHGRMRSFDKGEVLVQAGEHTTRFFVLVEGELELVRPSETTEDLVAIYRPGMFTGEVNMLSGRRGFIQIRTTVASKAIEVERERLLELIKSDKRRDFLSLVSRYQGYP